MAALPRAVELQKIKELVVLLQRADALMVELSGPGQFSSSAPLSPPVIFDRIALVRIMSRYLSRAGKHLDIQSFGALILGLNPDTAPESSPDTDEEVSFDDILPAGPAYKKPGRSRSRPRSRFRRAAPESDSEPDSEPDSEAGPPVNANHLTSSPTSNLSAAQFNQIRTQLLVKAESAGLVPGANGSHPAKANQLAMRKKYPDALARSIPDTYVDPESNQLVCSICRGPVDSHPVDEILPPHPDGRLPLILCNDMRVVYQKNQIVRNVDPSSFPH
jgi:hypothetical protein